MATITDVGKRRRPELVEKFSVERLGAYYVVHVELPPPPTGRDKRILTPDEFANWLVDWASLHDSVQRAIT